MLIKVLRYINDFWTKLDYSFSKAQFYIGFITSFRLDRNKHGGGILLYVPNNNKAILLTGHVYPNNIEAFFAKSMKIFY